MPYKDPQKIKEYRKRYYFANKLNIKEQSRQWRKNNPERDKELHKQWAIKNKEKILQSVRKATKKWVANHPQKAKRIWLDYYYRNREKILQEKKKNYNSVIECAKAEKYRRANLDKVRAYVKKRRKEDVQYRLASYLRSRLAGFLRGKERHGSAVKLLGCSLDELKIHLEKQFESDMTWSNYGKWHLDHKIPLSSFDLTDISHLQQACHHTNLQPLWARENIIKSNKL